MRMTNYSIFFLLLFFISNYIYGQITVTGKVISKNDKLPLPGVNVFEKGTSNYTTTDIDGEFKLQTTTRSTILTFSFIGFVTKEVSVNEEKEIFVSIKEDCIRDYFDVQEILFYLTSGLINNPVGGNIDLSFPAFFRKGTFRGGFSYQTNFMSNYLLMANIEYNHFIWTCDYELSAGLYFRDVNMLDEFKVYSNSFETKHTFDGIFNSTVIIGLSNLDFRNNTSDYIGQSNGLIIGSQLWTGRILKAIITTKAAIHKNNIEWQAQVKRRFGRINTFINFYKLDTFSELSLGIGYEFVYRFRKNS